MAKSVASLLSGYRWSHGFLVFSVLAIYPSTPVLSADAEISALSLPWRSLIKISVDGGQQLVLGCDSYNPVTSDKLRKLMWVRCNITDYTETPLFYDTVRLLRKHERYQLVNGFDLEIHNATYEDIAVFQCYDLLHPEVATRYLVDVQNLPSEVPIHPDIPEDSGVRIDAPKLKDTTTDESGIYGDGTGAYYDAQEEEAEASRHHAGVGADSVDHTVVENEREVGDSGVAFSDATTPSRQYTDSAHTDGQPAPGNATRGFGTQGRKPTVSGLYEDVGQRNVQLAPGNGSRDPGAETERATVSGLSHGHRQDFIGHSADNTMEPFNLSIVKIVCTCTSSAGRLLLTVTNVLMATVCSFLIL